MKIRLVFVVVVAVALAAAGCSSNSGEPADVIHAYVAAYNSGDLDAVVAVFADDASITGHPSNSGGRLGQEFVRALHFQDLTYGNGYTVSNVETSGNTVTWDSVWGNGIGCVEGHTSVVEGDKIVSWVWGTEFDCP